MEQSPFPAWWQPRPLESGPRPPTPESAPGIVSCQGCPSTHTHTHSPGVSGAWLCHPARCSGDVPLPLLCLRLPPLPPSGTLSGKCGARAGVLSTPFSPAQQALPRWASVHPMSPPPALASAASIHGAPACHVPGMTPRGNYSGETRSRDPTCGGGQAANATAQCALRRTGGLEELASHVSSF